MLGATNIGKNRDKGQFVYRSYGIAFDGKCQCCFGNDTGKNVIISGVDNSSSSHTDNLKKDFLILGDGATFGINGRFVASVKNMILILLNKDKILLEFAL